MCMEVDGSNCTNPRILILSQEPVVELPEEPWCQNQLHAWGSLLKKSVFTLENRKHQCSLPRHHAFIHQQCQYYKLSTTTIFNECGKCSSGAIPHYVACCTGTTRPGSDLFTNSQCLPEVENGDDLGELVLEGDDDLDCLSILTG